VPASALVEAFARNIETLPETYHQTFLTGITQRLVTRPPNLNLDLESESYRKRKPAALRAVAVNEKSKGTVPEPDARMIRLAGEVLRETPREQPMDYYVDAVLSVWRQHQIEGNRGLVIVALAKSQKEQTA
jgi:hypothetical protein